MRRTRKAKIVATLGPASSTQERIAELFKAGADVFRLNFSHGSPEDHRRRYEAVRAVEAQFGRPIGILMDLQGPKFRIGTFANGPVTLTAGEAFRLDLSAEPGDQARAPLPHPEVMGALVPGAELLLDDGRIRLRVEACGADYAATRVVAGGRLSDRKGVNLPGVVLPLSPLTEKDRQDLAFGLDLGCDWVALSFVQRPEDVAEARRLVQGRAAVLVKLEKPSAIDKLDELIEQADAVMLSAETASGDYPIEAVSMMDRIIRRVEVDPSYRRIVDTQHPEPEATAADAISAAAAQCAHTLSAAAIATYTTSGSTTLRAARERPEVPILCLTSKLETARRLALVWGTHCVHTEDVHSFSEMVVKACGIALEQEMAASGQRLVVTAGVPFGTPGATNVLRIAWVE